MDDPLISVPEGSAILSQDMGSNRNSRGKQKTLFLVFGLFSFDKAFVLPF